MRRHYVSGVSSLTSERLIYLLVQHIAYLNVISIVLHCAVNSAILADDKVTSCVSLMERASPPWSCAVFDSKPSTICHALSYICRTLLLQRGVIVFGDCSAQSNANTEHLLLAPKYVNCLLKWFVINCTWCWSNRWV